VLKSCPIFVGGFSQVGFDLDRPGQSVQPVMHMAQVQKQSEICRRFGGGLDRNRALLGNEGNSMHDMQIVQSRHCLFRILLIWRVGT
jgi:hypothetical protein